MTAEFNHFSNETAQRILKGVIQKVKDAQLDTVETMMFFAWMEEQALSGCIGLLINSMTGDGQPHTERLKTVFEFVRWVARLQAKGVASHLEKLVDSARHIGIEVSFEGDEVKFGTTTPTDPVM